MDVLGLILVCSMYPDEHLVRAMVDAASQGNQYFVADVATLVTFDKTASQDDARKLVTELEKQGGRPLIGLMGLPPAWLSRAAAGGTAGGKPGSTGKVDLFDACTNLRIGTTVLADHYQSCLRTHTTKVPEARAGGGGSGDRSRAQRMAPPEAIRLCALRRFGAEIGFEGYAEAVLGYLTRQRVLFAPSGVAVMGGSESADANSCRCEEPVVARPRRVRPRGEASASRTAEGGGGGGPSLSPGGAPILD